MANHLTTTELAREAGLERRDVIVKCVELGVPIFNGRIDKTLFLSSLRELPGSASAVSQGNPSRMRVILACSLRIPSIPEMTSAAESSMIVNAPNHD